jgi:hypothetical protein
VDPAETRNVVRAHPEVRAEHASRMNELARKLGAPDAGSSRLSEEDRRRLRALGYDETD